MRRLPLPFVATLAILGLVPGMRATALSSGERIASVAVFPVENLASATVGADGVKRLLIERLVSAGIPVVQEGVLDEFMARHRVRYAAGIDGSTAESLRQETGVDAVLMPSIETSRATIPPRFAVVARLVSIKGAPTVVWGDDAGMAGDEAPGFFGLGVVNDYGAVQARSVRRVADSLLAYLKGNQMGARPKTASKFRPKSFYRAVVTDPGRPCSVAVVPFFNLSARQNAGEILALLFVRHLSAFPQFRVIETGVVRRQLLDARIIMSGGLSITDADTVAGLIDADLVLGGRVVRYEDADAGTPRVDFSTVLIEKKSRRVVWSSHSYNEGSDGVWFFDRGTSRTAHAMATQMVGRTAGMIAGHDR